MPSVDMKQWVFVVYTEPSVMWFDETRSEKLPSVIGFRDSNAIFPRKMYFSATGRCYLRNDCWRKQAISMLYFSAISKLTHPRINNTKR